MSRFELVVNKIKSKIYKFKLYYTNGLKINGKITVLGKPIITIRNDASIVIDDNVTLNSQNLGYHVNMHSPVKLFADRKNSAL